MRRDLLLIALAAPLMTGCSSATPGTEPEEEIELPEPEEDFGPDTVPAIAFAMLEGTAPYPDSTLVYSCGPGLFGGSTMAGS